MTSPEHTLVGIHLAFATGVHHYLGWRGVVVAGVASNLPDWDGIPMLFDMQRFEHGHRVWGHGVLSIVLTSLLFAFAQVRWDWVGRAAMRLQAFSNAIRVEATEPPNRTRGLAGLAVLTTLGICVQAVHLLCDMVVSGGNGLSDWAVQPWWPFSNAAYVYPMIPWGDIGPTIILMAGVIIMAKRNGHFRSTAWLTLITLCGYLLARLWFR